MNGIHDLGGMEGFGPVPIEKDEPVFHHDWEGRVMGLRMLMGFWRKWNLDAGRHSIEMLPPADYLTFTYYEKWLASAVNLDESPEIQALLADYDADLGRFPDGEKRTTPVYDDNPFYIRDYNQCVNCWRCVQVCADDAQFAYALNFDGRGFHTTIGTFQDRGMMDTTCVFCGQCVGVCPTGALKPKRQALLEEGVNPDEIFFQTRGGRKKKGKKRKGTP